MWPRTAAVYCHRALGWPDDPDVVERVPVRSCQRRGAAVDLVLDRARENRSQFVFTQARGRDVIFWQSARTSRQARPNVALPRARAAGLQLEILVDTHERYPWTFNHQQATHRPPRPAGRRLRRRAGRAHRRHRRTQVARRPGVDDDGGQAPLPPRRARRRAQRGGRRRGPLLGGLQARARPSGRRRRWTRRGGGPLPERADRVRRDPPARPGVDLPVSRRRRRPPPRGRRCRTTGRRPDAGRGRCHRRHRPPRRSGRGLAIPAWRSPIEVGSRRTCGPPTRRPTRPSSATTEATPAQWATAPDPEGRSGHSPSRCRVLLLDPWVGESCQAVVT